MTAFTPVPLFQDAPSDVPRNEETDRFLQLYFLDEDPLEVFDDRFGGLGKEFDASGLGRILFVSPFLATVAGHRPLHRRAPVAPGQRGRYGQWRQPESQHSPRSQRYAAVITNNPVSGST